jgi:hypothetical protein
MSSENYVAINVTNIPEGKHQGILVTMSEIAQSVNIFWCISCLFWHADEWPESRGSSIFAGF